MSDLPLPDHRPPRVLGLFAHPDDEVFCFGGTIARLVTEGAAARIVSFTQGEGGQIRDAALGSRRTLGAVRTTELSNAARALGVRDASCLDFADGRLVDVPVETLVDVAGEIIRDFEPDVVVSFGPDGATGHPDHIVMSHVVAAAGSLCEKDVVVLQSVFPKQPRLLLRLIVDWLENLGRRFMGTEAFAHGLMLFADGSSMLGYAADHLSTRFYPDGTAIIEQGEPPAELYLILSGLVQVVHEDESGKFTTIASLGPGSFIGEDGIAAGQPRNAHVIASGSVTCFVLSAAAISGVATRGEGTGGPASKEMSDPTALPVGLIEVDVRHFVNTKMRALACHRSQYAIDPNTFPESLVQGIFSVEYFEAVPSDR